MNYRPNDRVEVRKYGGWYRGTVVEVKRTGTLRVRFTPKNGREKVATIAAADVTYDVKRAY